MKYLTIFFAVWSSAILYFWLIVRWPREAKEIRASYPGRLILKGFILPRVLKTKFSDGHFQVFVDFRRRYLFFWFSLLFASIALIALAFLQLNSENEAFETRMQEKYFGD